MATTKSEEIREKMNDKEKDEEIESWMKRNNLPEETKNVIRKNVKKKLGENKDVHVENLLSILPRKDKKSIKRHLCMNTLKKVPKLQSMDESVLNTICDYLKPVIYTKTSLVIRKGEPLDFMLFNNDGILLTYNDGSVSSSSTVTQSLNKGDYYGEELLTWASEKNSYGDLPLSTQNVKCSTKVEAFYLMAKDLKAAFSKSGVHFISGAPSNRNKAHRMQEMGLCFVRSLRVLRALRLNRSRSHSERNSNIQGDEELGYQPLYSEFPKSDASF